MHALEPDQAVNRAALTDASLLDLDRDGRRDLFITAADWCGTGGCPYWVYLARGRCGEYVGEIEGRKIRSLGTGRHGLLDLGYTWWLGCCDRLEQVARFDGTVYRVSQRDCRLSRDAADDAWTCARWHAAAAPP